MLAACAETRCEDAAPLAEFEISVNSGALTRPISALDVRLTVLADDTSAAKQRRFEIAGELDDGRTSLAVQLQPQPTNDFAMVVSVEALDTAGQKVASGQARFSATPDACNVFSLGLIPEIDPQMDAGIADVGMLDQGPIDMGPGDLGFPDIPMMPDMGPKPPLCAQTPDPQTVALYTFEGDDDTRVLESTNAHPGLLINQGGGVLRGGGQDGCGNALTFSQNGHVRIPDAPEFQLGQGAVDFWVRFPEGNPAESQGIISRDATGQVTSGHITIYRSCQNFVIVRLQNLNQSIYRCSEASLPANEWVHVGVNFGVPDLELYINGAQAVSESTLGLNGADCATPVQCGGALQTGINGNQNVWVFGASSATAIDGAAEPIPVSFFEGSLDSVRLSSSRREF